MDSQWLERVFSAGLIKPSYIPEKKMLELKKKCSSIAFLMPTNVLLTSAIAAHLADLFVALPLITGVTLVFIYFPDDT